MRGHLLRDYYASQTQRCCIFAYGNSDSLYVNLEISYFDGLFLLIVIFSYSSTDKIA